MWLSLLDNVKKFEIINVGTVTKDITLIEILRTRGRFSSNLFLFHWDLSVERTYNTNFDHVLSQESYCCLDSISKQYCFSSIYSALQSNGFQQFFRAVCLSSYIICLEKKLSLMFSANSCLPWQNMNMLLWPVAIFCCWEILQRLEIFRVFVIF